MKWNGCDCTGASVAGVAVRGGLHAVRPDAEEGVALQLGAAAVWARAQFAQEPAPPLDHPPRCHAAGDQLPTCIPPYSLSYHHMRPVLGMLR